jgi:hypothetical protein
MIKVVQKKACARSWAVFYIAMFSIIRSLVFFDVACMGESV